MLLSTLLIWFYSSGDLSKGKLALFYVADIQRIEDEVDLAPKAKGLIRGKAKWDKEIFSCSYYICTVLSHA